MNDSEKLEVLIRIINGFDYVTVDFNKEHADIVIDGYTYVSLEDGKFFNSILKKSDD